MNRKRFLSSLWAAGAVLPALGADMDPGPGFKRATLIPPYLRPGDLIGITCPAGWITQQEIQPAVSLLEQWGFRVQVGDTVGKKEFTFGGTDEQRTADFQKMLDDKNIRAILCARGGYGSVRIIDSLHFAKLAAHPKWILGFSDITVLHSHLSHVVNIASIHSKMCNSFPEDWSAAEPQQRDSLLSIRTALTGEPVKYVFEPNPANRSGTASGALTGGNLKTLESLSGTRSDISTAGRILFVEDTGEYLYSIDRMFWNLKRTGKLSGLKALIIGGFKVKPDDPGDEFGKTLQEIILEKVKDYKYPVCFDFPCGHQKYNVALKCGVKHRLKVSSDSCSLMEVI